MTVRYMTQDFWVYVSCKKQESYKDQKNFLVPDPEIPEPWKTLKIVRFIFEKILVVNPL